MNDFIETNFEANLELVKKIQETEGDDFFIIDEFKIQEDLRRAYEIFEIKNQPGGGLNEDPDFAAFSQDLHDLVADFDTLGRDKRHALHELEDEIYDLLDPILKEDAFKFLEESFDSVYDSILGSVNFAGGDYSFSFEYDGDVVAGSFNREYRVEVVEFGDRRVEFNPPCRPRDLEQVFTCFKHTLGKIVERDDIYPFLGDFPTFVCLDPMRYDFYIDIAGERIMYLATPFDILRVDEQSDRRRQLHLQEYRRKEQEFKAGLTRFYPIWDSQFPQWSDMRGALSAVIYLMVDDDCNRCEQLLPERYRAAFLALVELAKYLETEKSLTRILYDDKHGGTEVEEVTSVGKEYETKFYYKNGGKFSKMLLSSAVIAIVENDAPDDVVEYNSHLVVERVLKQDGEIFYDSSHKRPLYGLKRSADTGNVLFLVQPDGGYLYDFGTMKTKDPGLTTQDFFASWKEIIRTADDYYVFEEQFLTLNQVGIEDMRAAGERLKLAFPENLQLMMRKYAKELIGVADLELSIEQKYGVEIESDDWSMSGMSHLSNFRMELSVLRNVLNDLNESLGKIPTVALRRTGLKKIYVFQFWEGPGVRQESRQQAGGYAFGNGAIGISDGTAAFFHELRHCADEHEGGWVNDDTYWGVYAHGADYESIYGKSGVDAIDSGVDLNTRPKGFVSGYAKLGGIGEDQASMGDYLFRDYRLVMQYAEEEPELARKVEMEKHFWSWLSDPNGGDLYDPTMVYNGDMNDQYWEDLADGKVNDYWDLRTQEEIDLDEWNMLGDR